MLCHILNHKATAISAGSCGLSLVCDMLLCHLLSTVCWSSTFTARNHFLVLICKTVAPKATKAKAKMPKTPLTAPWYNILRLPYALQAPWHRWRVVSWCWHSKGSAPCPMWHVEAKGGGIKGTSPAPKGTRQPGWWERHWSGRVTTARGANVSTRCALGLNTPVSPSGLALTIQFLLHSLPPESWVAGMTSLGQSPWHGLQGALCIQKT